MAVWIKNEEYGLDFTIEGRQYGSVTGWSVMFGWLTWRYTLLKVAREAAKSPWVEKCGLQWNALQQRNRP